MNSDRIFTTALLVAAILFTATVLAVPPSIEAPAATPIQITEGTPTDVVITARVNSTQGNPAVITKGLHLLRLDLNGNVISDLGIMQDDGTGSDTTVGDSIYTVRVNLNEPSVGQVRLRVSAVFHGPVGRKLPPVSTPVLSPIATLAVVESVNQSVPDLYGLDLVAAEASLTGAGLAVGEIGAVSSIATKTAMVMRQYPIAGTAVTKGTAVDLVLAAPLPNAKGGENIPEAWVGRWKVTTTYRDAETDAIDSVVETIDDICTGDPIGLALVEQVSSGFLVVQNMQCSGSATDARIRSSCSGNGQVEIDVLGTCATDLKVRVDLTLTGDTFAGLGAWRAGDSCNLPLPMRAQTFTLSSVRLGPSTDSCSGPTSSLVQKFFRTPLFALAGGTP